MLPFETVRILGRDHRLQTNGGPPASWARDLIDDPREQHVVHLLIAALMPASAARVEWSELMLRLEDLLNERYVAIPIEGSIEHAA